MRIGRAKNGQQDVVYGITDAQKPLSQDIRSRESKYLMAMGIRVAAFLLIVILPIAWPWKLGLAVLALVLPYIAVVYANGGREPEPGADSRYLAQERLALLSGRVVGEDGERMGRASSGSADAAGSGPGGAEAADADVADSAPGEPISGRIMGDDE